MSQPSPRRERSQTTERRRVQAHQLLEQAEQLPTLPDIPARVLDLLGDPDAALAEVGDIIALDPVLAARCLRLANSPSFSAGDPIQTIHSAVVRLGTRELQSLLVTLSLMEALKSGSKQIDVREVWRYAVATAVLARRLARDLSESQPDLAYLAGLLHPLGEVVLATCFQERFDAAMAEGGADEARGALIAEFGVEPSQCCARILEHWRMPATVAEAVEFQDRPHDAPEAERLATIVQTASRACRAFGIGASPSFRPQPEWRETICTALIFEASGGAPEHYLAALEETVEPLGEILTALLA